MNLTLHHYLLVLITFLAALLRIYNLHDLPNGFVADEASFGYNAYSILTTGKDEHGEFFPVFFQAFGEYKNPIFIYSTVPLVHVLGLNEFAVRLTSALYGVFTIPMLFLLVRELFKSSSTRNHIALCSALILALTPWHVHLSRLAFESSIYVFYITVALFFFFKGISNSRYILISALFFGLSMYTYFPARIFVPALMIFLTMVNFDALFKHKKITLGAGVIFIVCVTPILISIFTPAGWSRWSQVNIFSNPPKEISIAKHIITNYLSHFSLDFLFFKGDTGMPGNFTTRHSVVGVGQLHMFQLPLLWIGLFHQILRGYKKQLIFVIGYLLLYPLGNIFTVEISAQATRTAVGVIPLSILSGIGLSWIISLKSKQVILNIFKKVLIIGIILTSAIGFLRIYYYEYPKISSDFWGWQYGARGIVTYFVEQEARYDEMYMESAFNAPHIFFNFYAPGECEKCTLGLPHERYDVTKRQLFAVTPYYLEEHPEIQFKILKTLFYPDKKVAFQIGEIVQ